jgi:hypothetical protein
MATALLAPAIANITNLPRLRLGAIAGRLAGQALSGESVAVAIALSVLHWRAAHRWRAAVLAVSAAILVGVSVDAYYIEPRLLFTRKHTPTWLAPARRGRCGSCT